MNGTPDILVIGGGVIGLTCAYHLAAAGWRVTLVEQGPLGQQSSWAGAGILPDANPDYAPTPSARLRALSLRLFPTFSATLREETGLDNGYRPCGGIEFLPPNHPPTDEWHSEGTQADPLSPSQVADLTEGWSSPPLVATHLPGMAQVRNPWHLRVLESACRQRGVVLLDHWPVQRLDVQANRFRAVQGQRGELTAGQALLCGGAWTAQLLQPLGLSVPIRPVRGQMLLFRQPPARRPILLSGKRYIVPREDGMILVGSTEEEAGFDATTTPTAIADLRSFAAELVPALADAPLEQAWAGLRPASADGWPYLGPVPGYRNLHLAAGHFRSGILLSPITGLLLTQHLTGQPTAVPLEAFSLQRPPAG